MALDNNTITRIYHQLDRIEENLERVMPELSAIKTDLSYHIRRTDLLEEQFKIIDKDINRLYGFFTISGWLVAAGATLLTILNMLGYLK